MGKRKIDSLFFRALLLAALPVLCCVVTCAAQGKSIGDVYLPCSPWNDEFIYYKQVEGIVNFGYPQGYFGYNESHALKLSFAAWSPVLVLPWILWGLVFGWGLMSPVICNIFLMSAAVFLFAWLARINWKQTGVLALLFCLYTPLVRYMLSGMPEVICMSLLIVFNGVALDHQRKENAGKLAALFALSGLLTLMRPYMLLFLMLPVFFWIRSAGRRGKLWQGILGSAAVTGMVLGCYALIKHYLSAEYFQPLFFTDWITVFFREGIGAGIRNFLRTLYWKGTALAGYMADGVKTGLASGAFFAGYLVMLAVLAWQSGRDWLRMRRRRREGKAEEPDECGILAVETHLAFSFLGMFFAILLMYELTQGSKHLLLFMAAGIFVVSVMETKFYKKAVLIGAVFVFFYSYKATEPYDYQIPFREGEREAQLREWQTIFDGNLEINRENVPNYDNVLIWVFDEQDPKTGQHMEWRILYALPEGFGISCCRKDYVLEHFAELNSRYILVCAGTETDERCLAAGCPEIGSHQGVVLYELPRAGSGR